MGVATGVFQYPNGSPVANGIYQWKLSSDAIEQGTACIAPPVFYGYLDSSGNMTATFLFNDVLATAYGTNTTYQLTVKALNGGQVWNENYYLTGTAANINSIYPGSSSSGPVLYPFNRVAEIAYTMDGLGSVVATGIKGQVNIPMLCVITGWVLTADQSGAATVGVNACPFASFPSGLANICGTDFPRLTSQQANENLAVSLWSPTLSAGTQVQFSVSAASTVTRLNLGIIVNIPYGF